MQSSPADARGGEEPVASPVQGRSGVGLAASGDLVVARQIGDRIAPTQGPRQAGEGPVLRVGVRQLVGSLELDADRKVVAALAPLPGRRASVPGTQGARNELQQRSVTSDQKVRGDTQGRKGFETRMRAADAVGEQLDDAVASELARRQGYAVHYQERYALANRPQVAIGRWYLRGCRDGSRSVDIESAHGDPGFRTRIGSEEARNRRARFGGVQLVIIRRCI